MSKLLNQELKDVTTKLICSVIALSSCGDALDNLKSLEKIIRTITDELTNKKDTLRIIEGQDLVW